MTDTTDKKPRRFMADGEIYKAMGLMHDHLRGPVAGLWTYADGYTDQRIADEIGNGATLNNIVGLRERNFGKLSKGEAISDPRLEMLLAAHDALVSDIAAGTFIMGSDPAPYLVGDQS